MESEIVVGLLAFAGTLIGAYSSNNKNMAVTQEQIKDIKEDIVNLSSRVDKHNNVIERQFRTEEQVKSLEHRVNMIENS